MSKRKQTYRSPAEIQAFLDDLDPDAEFSDLSNESEKEGNYFVYKFFLLEKIVLNV